MNDTVAVALITSLSTLTAATVAGAVSVRVTGRQLRHQQALAREEREEQRALARRDMRREACEGFLSQVDAAYRVLDAAWTAARDAAPDEAARFAARRTLDEALIRLRLTGPDELAEQATAVVAAVSEEFRLLGDSGARSRALRTRATVTDAFTRTARRVLVPDALQVPHPPAPARTPGPSVAGHVPDRG